jgi:hypothetical protein
MACLRLVCRTNVVEGRLFPLCAGFAKLSAHRFLVGRMPQKFTTGLTRQAQKA